MNRQQTVAVYQYTLTVASREDDYVCRELGPIHLLKYAYLVDLDYARHHGGETFTGIDWRFHSFGPWSTAAHGLIAWAMATTGIQERRVPSNYGEDDFVRWSVDLQSESRAAMGSELPLEVRGTLDTYVHRFGSDTPTLLHHVYTTPPMLHSAPGEALNFEPVPRVEHEADDDFVPLLDRMSRSKRSAFSARMNELRSKFDLHQTDARPRLSSAGRVDADFAETAAWVNSLAGPAFPDEEAKVTFEDSVWHSETRQGHAVS